MEQLNGGRFDFDDGGTYCGGWEEGKAHGHGVCTGPKSQGEYAGAWHYGFEVSGVYTWPSGNTYAGQWQNGKRHGIGVEHRGHWLYRGEWTQGYKGRYGVRQSTSSNAKFEGTWSSGLQDGYGKETYADGGTYNGQWLRGMRHGYGIRKSAPYGVAAKYRSRSKAHASLTSLRSNAEEEPDSKHPVATDFSNLARNYADESRGGFALRANSEFYIRRRSLSERSLAMRSKLLKPFQMKKQRSTGDIHQKTMIGPPGSIKSSGSTVSCASDESATEDGAAPQDVPAEEFVEPDVVETYIGEWKNDKRSGFGVSERSDGLKYEGEWFNNKKFGYGVTTLKDGVKEEGKYKNNVLVTSNRKRHLLFVRSSKLRERIDSSVSSANRAAQLALQKVDIGMSRTATARERGDQADSAAAQAQEDSDLARIQAKQFDPNFHQPGTHLLKKQRQQEHANQVPYTTTAPSISTEVNGTAPHRAYSLALPKQPEKESHSPRQGSPALETKAKHVSVSADHAMASLSVPKQAFTSSKENLASLHEHNHVNANREREKMVQVAFFDQPTQAKPAAADVKRGESFGDDRSMTSDNLIITDHFDQYGKAIQPGGLRRSGRDRKPPKAPPVARPKNAPPVDTTSEIGVKVTSARRSTLASAEEMRAIANQLQHATQRNSFVRPEAREAGDAVAQENDDDDETKGSLPDLTELTKHTVKMPREMASRLSSQRRQELQRLEEESELLRSNPLRYLFHPAVQAWFVRWKLPIVFFMANLCLTLMFYQLLTYIKPEDLDNS